ncbi:MAG: MFS transporter [Rickettsiales bacterium]|jgi:MFS family permease|nr:MFS transporter [Rickettsiales bacterium]
MNRAADRSDKKALGLLKWGEFFKDFMLVLPVATLLYQSKGITVGDFFLIQGMFRVTSFLFEIPSGYISGAMSGRKVLLLGATIWFAALACLFRAHGFWQIAACEMAMGLSYALFSETQEAYAYDLLKRMGREKDFIKENGGIMAFSQAASVIGVLLGGYLYAFVGDFIIAIEAAAAFLAVICAWQLPELAEDERKTAPESSPLRRLAGVIKTSATHPEIKWLLIFPALSGSFAVVLMWILQPAMEAARVPVAMFGIFLGLNQSARAALSKCARIIAGAFGGKKILPGCVLALAAALGAVAAMPHAGDMAAVYALCAFAAIVPAAHSLCKTVTGNYIRERIRPAELGAVMSAGGMYSMFLSGGMLMLMKPLLDGFGIRTAMLAALSALAITLVPLGKILRMKS